MAVAEIGLASAGERLDGGVDCAGNGQAPGDFFDRRRLAAASVRV